MPHILFLMSDTGGGHRAASRAIEAALQERHAGQFTTELVDVWKDYTPFPFNTAPQSYSRWVNASPSSYSAYFWVGDRLFRQRQWSQLYCEQMFPRMKHMYHSHPADVIVCVHSVFVRPAVYALRKLGLTMPFITVITDYALPTVLWYDPKVDRCLVPTEPAYKRGLSLGMQPSQMVLTGAPVHPKFTKVTPTKEEARRELGWSSHLPVVLLIGGGDGMGPLVATARAIDAQPSDCQLVVVAGRNAAMKAALDAVPWRRPTRIYGFVNNMQVFMRAADLLITKAGPATITEAALLGLPMVLSGAIKYQESPNVDYVVSQGAGIDAPGPKRTAEAVESLLAGGGSALRKLAAGAKKLAQPDAIWKIADEIWSFVPERYYHQRAD
jgi:1,2-diacylglycerol 3-beta-galactosyltransferase